MSKAVTGGAGGGSPMGDGFPGAVWLSVSPVHFQVQRLHHGLRPDREREDVYHVGPAAPGRRAGRRGTHPQGHPGALQVPAAAGGVGLHASPSLRLRGEAGTAWGEVAASQRCSQNHRRISRAQGSAHPGWLASSPFEASPSVGRPGMPAAENREMQTLCRQAFFRSI